MTHRDMLIDELFILLDPPLYLHNADEEAQVGSERIMMFLRFHRWGDAVP
jgi:hypothetical protein